MPSKTARTINIKYAYGCPNCGGDIDAERLEAGLPCAKCLSDAITRNLSFRDREDRILKISELLQEKNRLAGYLYISTIVKEFVDFKKFFEKILGHSMLDAQEAWALRLIQGENIAIVAPTGVGKTTLLSIYALYRALNGFKAYYLLPTTNLVIQIVDKLENYIKKVNQFVKIAYYHSNLKKHEKEKELELINARDFDILVTTTSFLSRKWSLLSSMRFDLLLVDDVDSVLRNSRNIDRILILAGFHEDVLNKGYELVKLKIDAAISKMNGRMKKYEEILLKIKEAEQEIQSALSKAKIGQIVIASATGRTIGLKPKLFRELAGFEIGRVFDYTRNIANYYCIVRNKEEIIDKVVKLVEQMRAPGLIFVSRVYGKNLARLIVEELVSRGIRAKLALTGTKSLDRFARGDIDVLVGVASYYGVIVRGIDLPKRVYYTLFAGTPALSLDLSQALTSPYRIVRLASELGIIDENSSLIKLLSRMKHNELNVLRIALQNNEELLGKYESILKKLRETRSKIIERLLSERRKRRRLLTSIGVIDLEEMKLIIPDAATYVQASGRASRMLNTSMTYGISIIVDVDKDLVDLLARRLSRFIEKPSFNRLSTKHLAAEVKKAKQSREKRGKRIDIETSVLIVESPTKARTIASFFGKPVKRRIGKLNIYETTFFNEYTSKIYVMSIIASRGHIFDLTIDPEGLYGVYIGKDKIEPVYAPIKQCSECGAQFASKQEVCPYCGSHMIQSKEDVVDALRKLVIEAGNVYIATDPDTEGEKIAYDIYLMVKPFAKRIRRIEMHEITRKAFLKALAEARDINRNTVYAQVVRRIEDRWIGFTLSERLWSRFGKKWLGAGRVQTPVLGWIIARHREWKEKRSYTVYIVLEDQESPSGRIIARLYLKERNIAEEVANKIKDGLKVVKITRMERLSSPLPPYTTETLIYDASKLLKYTSEKTMRIAQDLFENGLITYHRTDSVHVSSQGISIAREYLTKKGYVNLISERTWAPPGPHEAIRPTKPLDVEELRKSIAFNEIRVYNRFTEAHYRLYDLIFRRFMASQMKETKLLAVNVVFEPASGEDSVKGVEFEVFGDADIIDSGHAVIAPYIMLLKFLNKLREGDIIKPKKVFVTRGSQVALYTHGDIILLMKKKGIGRPSTYAKTVATLIRHGYIVESKYRKYLVPTRLGYDVYNYLSSVYGRYISEERTRSLYRKMDMIGSGLVDPIRVIDQLYNEVLEIREGRRESSIRLDSEELTSLEEVS